jgi:outer membrane protein assembly factor BamB
MQKNNLIVLVVGIFFAASLSAQIKITKAERLPISQSHQWTLPVFSQNGEKVYFTEENFDGIWEYTRSSKSVRQVCDDSRSGFGFSLSADGRQLAYRTTANEGSRDRVQRIIVKDIQTDAVNAVRQGSDVAAPVFSGQTLVSSDAVGPENAAPITGGPPVLLGIENTKIAMLVDGRKTLLDPLKGGSYIWSSLSPDKKLLLAYEMGRGAFVCDLEGNHLLGLGRCDAPAWTRDNKWIIYMADNDDGRSILSSEIMAISVDGKTTIPLTSTPDVLEMNPSCSPVDNTIVCSTAAGDLYLLTYEVAL